MTITDASDPVLVPTIGARSGVVMRQIVPRGAVWAVVLPDGAPGPFAEVWPPALPMRLLQPRFFQSSFFSGHRSLRIPLHRSANLQVRLMRQARRVAEN